MSTDSLLKKGIILNRVFLIPYQLFLIGAVHTFNSEGRTFKYHTVVKEL